MDTLRLEATPEAWARYHTDRHALLRADDGMAPLVAAWDRSVAAGAPVDGPSPDAYVLTGPELVQRRDSLGALLADGEDLLARVARDLANRDHVLLVASREGVVVERAGGGRFAADADAMRLVPGAVWAEPIRGTNAIGTAMVERRPTIVHGAAHYGRAFHELVCTSAPVRGPDGEIVAVLDASSWRASADPGVTVMVNAAALALEATLRARGWTEAGAAARRALERAVERASGVAVLIERPGRIVGCNGGARAWFAADPVARDCAAVLGVPWAALEREGVAPSLAGLAIGAGRRTLRVRVDPLLGADGAVVAVVAYGEPAAVTSRPPPRVGPSSDDPFARVFAEDPAVLAAMAFARRVAASDLPVVLLAETGAGKDVFAQAMHAASPRASGAFVAVNCGSLAPQLLESELFGYAPGAFTGATRNGREGLLQAAHGGTLFLDEVGEMPAPMQTALLRVLESGEYYRVGESVPRRADVRIIGATARDLVGAVERGTFRRDLYYRLKSVIVTIPPVRARSDRLALARRLVGDAPPFSAALERWIEGYAWPGNVRELKAVLSVVRLLGADASALDVSHLPPDLAHPTAPKEPTAASLADAEWSAVAQALAEVGGNVSAAARRLGVARSTVYRMLQRRAEGP